MGGPSKSDINFRVSVLDAPKGSLTNSWSKPGIRFRLTLGGPSKSEINFWILFSGSQGQGPIGLTIWAAKIEIGNYFSGFCSRRLQVSLTNSWHKPGIRFRLTLGGPSKSEVNFRVLFSGSQGQGGRGALGGQNRNRKINFGFLFSTPPGLPH